MGRFADEMMDRPRCANFKNFVRRRRFGSLESSSYFQNLIFVISQLARAMIPLTTTASRNTHSQSGPRHTIRTHTHTCLFNDVVPYKALIVSGRFRIMWNEAVLAYFKCLIGRSEENQDNRDILNTKQNCLPLGYTQRSKR